ncbi:MAG: hypothetical protein IIB00_09515, partial [candidate division Zixibacteria bacterium]|nr:hypothetical protein [candidate division Zixibacteria bacterium]
MKRRCHIALLIGLAVSFFVPRSVSAWLTGETCLLADSAYAKVIRDCEFDSTLFSKLSDIPFGDICANSSKHDFADERFHERRKSISEQLNRLTDSVYQELLLCDTCRFKPSNVVEGYLVNHMRALNKVGYRNISKKETQENLQEALHTEALAQGYLQDAFSAGHILSYNDLFLSSLQSRNKRQAHNYHRD